MDTLKQIERLAADLDASELDFAAVERIHAVMAQLLDVADELTGVHVEHVVVPALVLHGYEGLAGLLTAGPTDADEVH